MRMLRLTALLALATIGCYGVPRGGRRVHHVQIDVAIGGGERRTTGVRDDAELARVARSPVMTTGPELRLLTASGHGGGIRLESASSQDGPSLSVDAVEAVYAYERVAADGVLSLVGFAGPSRTRAHVAHYCYSDPSGILDPCGKWPPPPDLHAYDHVAWGGVLGIDGSARLGSVLVGLELAWRATRPVEDSPVGWNHMVMAQARVGLDIALAP
jgi:hypothetical protein